MNNDLTTFNHKPSPTLGFLLHAIKLIELNCQTWLATATFSSTSSSKHRKTQHQQQKQAVRCLLNTLLQHLSIDDELCEQNHPYRLKHQPAFVCFSHSQNQVAVLMNFCHPVGLDIECRQIPNTVIKRHFHPNEILWINQNLQPEQHAKTYQLLWQLKESAIKIQQNTLFMGIKQDFSSLLSTLLSTLSGYQNSLVTAPYHLNLANHSDILSMLNLNCHCNHYITIFQCNDNHLKHSQTQNLVAIY